MGLPTGRPTPLLPAEVNGKAGQPLDGTSAPLPGPYQLCRALPLISLHKRHGGMPQLIGHLAQCSFLTVPKFTTDSAASNPVFRDGHLRECERFGGSWHELVRAGEWASRAG